MDWIFFLKLAILLEGALAIGFGLATIRGYWRRYRANGDQQSLHLLVIRSDHLLLLAFVELVTLALSRQRLEILLPLFVLLGFGAWGMWELTKTNDPWRKRRS